MAEGVVGWLAPDPSGPDDVVVLVDARHEKVLRFAKRRIGSTLYGYGAGPWCALGGGRLALALRGPDLAVLISDLDGHVVAEWPVPATALSFGHLSADASGGSLFAVIDHVGSRRTVSRLTLSSGEWSDVAKTGEFVGDLDVSARGDVAYVSWPVESVPWEAGRLHVLEASGASWQVTDGTYSAPRWSDDEVGLLACVVERGEWTERVLYRNGREDVLDSGDVEWRPDWMFNWRWSLFSGGELVSVGVRHSQSTWSRAEWNVAGLQIRELASVGHKNDAGCRGSGLEGR
jgi:hypothetical protein